MFSKALALATVLVSSSSFASFYEVCTFETTVESVTRVAKIGDTVNEDAAIVAVIKINAAKSEGGHTDCSGHIGGTRVLELNGVNVEVGQNIKFLYTYMDGMTPEGVASSTTYEIIP
jgi:hypothetical protein